MAFFDPASVTLATVASGAASLAVARSSSGFLQGATLAAAGFCAINLALLLASMAAWALASFSTPAGLLASFTSLALQLLHLPSIIALGVDENLERHGYLVTSAGHVADLFLYALAYAGTLHLGRRAA